MEKEKLGALWVKSGPKGDFFTGEVEIDGVKTKLVIFQNGFKDSEKKPDWIIFKSQPKPA